MTAPVEHVSDHRQRILDAMAQVLVDKRYGDTTVVDIAAKARISKRTFYEHFSNKEDALLALCEHTAAHIMAVILRVYMPEKSWSQLVKEITHAYLHVIEASPALMHALYVELFATGRRGLEMRRKVGEQFADFMCGQVDMLRSKGEALKTLSRPTAIAVIAGINELILQAFMDGQVDTLSTSLEQTAQELVHAVTRVH